MLAFASSFQISKQRVATTEQKFEGFETNLSQIPEKQIWSTCRIKLLLEAVNEV